MARRDALFTVRLLGMTTTAPRRETVGGARKRGDASDASGIEPSSLGSWHGRDMAPPGRPREGRLCQSSTTSGQPDVPDPRRIMKPLA
jgi:hypothetical protein